MSHNQCRRPPPFPRGKALNRHARIGNHCHRRQKQDLIIFRRRALNAEVSCSSPAAAASLSPSTSHTMPPPSRLHPLINPRRDNRELPRTCCAGDGRDGSTPIASSAGGPDLCPTPCGPRDGEIATGAGSRVGDIDPNISEREGDDRPAAAAAAAVGGTAAAGGWPSLRSIAAEAIPDLISDGAERGRRCGENGSPSTAPSISAARDGDEGERRWRRRTHTPIAKIIKTARRGAAGGAPPSLARNNCTASRIAAPPIKHAKVQVTCHKRFAASIVDATRAVPACATPAWSSTTFLVSDEEAAAAATAGVGVRDRSALFLSFPWVSSHLSATLPKTSMSSLAKSRAPSTTRTRSSDVSALARDHTNNGHGSQKNMIEKGSKLVNLVKNKRHTQLTMQARKNLKRGTVGKEKTTTMT